MQLKNGFLLSTFIFSALSFAGGPSEPPQGIDIKSDVRFRDEMNKGRQLSSTEKEPGGNPVKEDISQNKIRIRLRSELSRNIGEFFQAGFRIATGNVDKNTHKPKHSTHVDANSHFEKLSLTLDRAYLNIVVNPDLILHLGKFGNPFISSGIYSEAVWDADIQPEGMALDFNYDTRENDWVKSGGFVTSLYFLENFETGKDPAFLTAEQAHITLPVLKAMNVTLGSGAYFFFNSHPQDELQYQIWDSFINTKIINLPVPLEFKFQWIYNWMTEHENMGYTVGASINKVKKLGDVSAYYYGQYLEENAVDPEYAQDDFKQAANMWGNEVGMKVGLADRVNMKFRLIFTNWHRNLNFFRGRVEFNANF